MPVTKEIAIHRVPQFDDAERTYSMSSLSEEGFSDVSSRLSLEGSLRSSSDGFQKKRISGHRVVGDLTAISELQDIGPYPSYTENSVSRSPSLGNLDHLSEEEELVLRANTQKNRHSYTFDDKPLSVESAKKNVKHDSTSSIPESLKNELLRQFAHMAQEHTYLDIDQLAEFCKQGYPDTKVDIMDGARTIMERFGRKGKLYENGFLLCYEQSWIEDEVEVKKEVLTRRNYITEQIRKNSNTHVRFRHPESKRRKLANPDSSEFLDTLTIPVKKKNIEQNRELEMSPLSTASSAYSWNPETESHLPPEYSTRPARHSSTSSGAPLDHLSPQTRKHRVTSITEYDIPKLFTTNSNSMNSPHYNRENSNHNLGNSHNTIPAFWNADDHVSSHHQSNSTMSSMGSPNSYGGGDINIPSIPQLPSISSHRSSEPDMHSSLRQFRGHSNISNGSYRGNSFNRPHSLSASSYRTPIHDTPLIEDITTSPYYNRDDLTHPKPYDMEPERYYPPLNDSYSHPRRQRSAGTWSDFQYGRSRSLKTREELQRIQRDIESLHHLNQRAEQNYAKHYEATSFEDEQSQSHWQHRFKQNTMKNYDPVQKNPPRRASVMHEQEYEHRSFNRPEFQLESHLKNKIENLSNKNKILQTEKEHLTKELEKSKNKTNEIKKELDEIKNQLSDGENKVMQFNRSIKKRDRTIDHQTVQINQQKVEIERLSKEMEKLRLQQRRNETLANWEGMPSSQKYQTCDEVLECVNKVFGFVHLFDHDHLNPDFIGRLANGLGFSDSHYFLEIVKSIVSYKSRIHELKNKVADYEHRFNTIKQDPFPPPAQANTSSNRKAKLHRPFSADNRARSMDERKRASTVTLGYDNGPQPDEEPPIIEDGYKTGDGDYDISLSAIPDAGNSRSDSNSTASIFAYGHMDVIHE